MHRKTFDTPEEVKHQIPAKFTHADKTPDSRRESSFPAPGK
jgi:hypothetical protein